LVVGVEQEPVVAFAQHGIPVDCVAVVHIVELDAMHALDEFEILQPVGAEAVAEVGRWQ
jgi:hypothetical protein